MPKASHARLTRSLRSGPKVEYKQWLRWKRIVERLRSRHGYSGTSLSLAVGAERGWMHNALLYPYNLRPREYQLTRELLRKETKVPIPIIEPELDAALRRLMRTLKSRGVSRDTISDETGYAVSSISKWVNTPEFRPRQSTADKIIAFARRRLGDDLVDQALNEAYGTPPSTNGDRPHQEAQEEAQDRPGASRTPDVVSWASVQALLLQAKEQLDVLLAELPSSARNAARHAVVEPVELALAELGQ